MKLNRPFVALSEEDGAGGGGTAVERRPSPIGPISDESGIADDDAEEAGKPPADDDDDEGAEKETPAEGDDAKPAEEETPAEGDDAKPAEDAAKDAEFEAWAEKNGYVKRAAAEEEPPAGDLPAANEQLSWEESPRDQAFREAEEQQKDNDWAEDRALEIVQERTELRQLHASRPYEINRLEKALEGDGLPKGAATGYFDSLMNIARLRGPSVLLDKEVQGASLRHALGDYVLREAREGRNPFAKAPAAAEEPAAKPAAHVTPTNGARPAKVDLKDLSPADQEYIAQISQKEYDGKPVPAAAIAKMRELGEIG